jgi:hypothetical protein
MPLFDSAALAVFELLLRSSEHLRIGAARKEVDPPL